MIRREQPESGVRGFSPSPDTSGAGERFRVVWPDRRDARYHCFRTRPNKRIFHPRARPGRSGHAFDGRSRTKSGRGASRPCRLVWSMGTLPCSTGILPVGRLSRHGPGLPLNADGLVAFPYGVLLKTGWEYKGHRPRHGVAAPRPPACAPAVSRNGLPERSYPTQQQIPPESKKSPLDPSGHGGASGSSRNPERLAGTRRGTTECGSQVSLSTAASRQRRA